MKKVVSSNPTAKVEKAFSNFRSEFKSTKKTIFSEFIRLENKIDTVQEKLSTKMDKQHDQVMTAISNFGGRVEKLEEENEIGSNQIRKLDKRVTTLESAA